MKDISINILGYLCAFLMYGSLIFFTMLLLKVSFVKKFWLKRNKIQKILIALLLPIAITIIDSFGRIEEDIKLILIIPYIYGILAIVFDFTTTRVKYKNFNTLQKAVALINLSLCIEVVLAVFDSIKLHSIGLGFPIFVVYFFIVSCTVIFVIQIQRGRSWGRFSLLILFILGTIFSFLLNIFMLNILSNSYSLLFSLIQVSLRLYEIYLQTWGIVYLFSHKSNEFFRK